MTVTVTKMPRGITQLFNTETGRVTYKCKSESGFMLIDAFGGIVRFNQKGAMATVTGHLTSFDSCTVIKENDSNYKEALIAVINTQKQFIQTKAELYQKEIQELERKLTSL
jgi:hypothetical protein